MSEYDDLRAKVDAAVAEIRQTLGVVIKKVADNKIQDAMLCGRSCGLDEALSIFEQHGVIQSGAQNEL